ncbi:MAG: hypothetical protein JWO98_2569 [Frankiales bacterium]|nr:hypothetical protein [Frankiales bacterium]
MDVIQLRDLVIKALNETDVLEQAAPIEGEDDAIGVETPDGELFFVKVIPA